MICHRRNHRNGQSLVEFAVVALVLYLLLAAILTFGHLLYVAQGLQGAVDLAAREISRTPLPALNGGGDSFDFEDAMSSSDVRLQIYDEAYLVIDLDNFYANFPPPPNRQTSIFQDLAPTLPLLNQQLLPLMIVETPADGSTGRLLRYPGALIERAQNIEPPGTSAYGSWVKTDLAVKIPLVVSRSDTGNETIQWVDVVEEIRADGAVSPYRIDSPEKGIVALRMNYPFQSASMSSFRHDLNASDFPYEATIGRYNIATNSVSGDDPSIGTVKKLPLTFVNESGEEMYAGTYGGKYGLGVQGAFGQTVRPFRRVISAQAIYRREIFQ